MKQDLRKRIMEHLSAAVAKDSHVITKCLDEHRQCFADDKEPEKR